MVGLLLRCLWIRVSASSAQATLQATLQLLLLLRWDGRHARAGRTWHGNTSLQRVLPVWQATQARRTEGAFAGSIKVRLGSCVVIGRLLALAGPLLGRLGRLLELLGGHLDVLLDLLVLLQLLLELGVYRRRFLLLFLICPWHRRHLYGRRWMFGREFGRLPLQRPSTPGKLRVTFCVGEPATRARRPRGTSLIRLGWVRTPQKRSSCHGVSAAAAPRAVPRL